MRKLTPLFWLQSTVLVTPLGFLLAGGCGGGSNSNPNGGFFGSPSAPPTVIVTPTPTSDPNATPTPTPTPTTAPTPTPTPIRFDNLSPEFSFSSQQAVSTDTSLRLFSSNTTARTLSISVPRTPVTTTQVFGSTTFTSTTLNTLGQAFPAATTALLARSDSPDPADRNVAGVTFVEGSKTWHSRAINGRSGTVVISLLIDGVVRASRFPGFLTFQLSEVTLLPDPSTDATGILIVTGPFDANRGIVESGSSFISSTPTPTPDPAGTDPVTAAKRR